ncbi:MSMEG_0565 family glycosyltransferase [Kribbella endophytica]
MRIALLSYSTKPRGGVVHTLALAEALAAAGEDVTVWSLGRGGDTSFFRAVDPRVTLSVVPFPELDGEGMGERILRSIAVLRDAFDGTAYDVVHAQDCISANAAGRCVRTAHHLDRFTTPELVACHERAIVEPYAHVCVSAAVADELAAGWGLKATVIPNGVDAERFAAAGGPKGERGRAAWREQLGRYLVTVGGIEPRKGSLELLEAFALVEDPTVQLVIAGGETLFDYRPYREAWDRRAAELGVAPIVLGPVDDDRLPTLVAGAEAFAFPSVKEGFGLAPMEALAAGVPLVVSDLPVFHEIFGSAATYAASAAELAAALTTPTDPERRAAGQALARSYTWQAAAQAHLAFYRSL